MVTLKNVSFTYDFTIHGGAISTIAMGVFVPNNSQLVGTVILPITNLTSGGSAVVNIGLIGNTLDGIIDNTTTQAAGAGTFVDYNSGTYGFTTANSGLNFIPSIYGGRYVQQIMPPAQVGLTISGATLTGGKFTATILYAIY